MRRITICEHITLDGVVQSPGAPDEDRDGGFPHGGWSPPFADPAVGAAVAGIHDGPRDLLLGRRTYDIWSAHWPHAAGPFAARFNDAVKHVGTHHPESLAWGPAQGLGDDVADGVRRLRAGDGPDLILWGSSTLAPVLLAHDLVDEVVLFVHPVLIGAGKRFFPDGAVPRSLALTESQPTGSGIVINRFRPAGDLRTGTFAPRGDQS